MLVTDLGRRCERGTRPRAQGVEHDVLVNGLFVEGITAGVVPAAAGAPLEEVACEVAGALDAERYQLEPLPGGAPSPTSGDLLSVDEVLINPEGSMPGLRRCSSRPLASTTPSS